MKDRSDFELEGFTENHKVFRWQDTGLSFTIIHDETGNWTIGKDWPGDLNTLPPRKRKPRDV